MRERELRQLIAGLLPAGLFGVSIALAPPAHAAPRAPDIRLPESAAGVAGRLSAIREAVSAALPDAGERATGPDPNIPRVWWANQGGRPWGWGNGGGWGWRNGGWRNGGWGNWHPWGNGGWGNWHPWGNG